MLNMLYYGPITDNTLPRCEHLGVIHQADMVDNKQ